MDTRLRTAFIYNKHNRRLRLHVPGSIKIKIVDHPWLWHGVLTKMVVLGGQAEDYGGMIQGKECHCLHLQYEQ